MKIHKKSSDKKKKFKSNQTIKTRNEKKQHSNQYFTQSKKNINSKNNLNLIKKNDTKKNTLNSQKYIDVKNRKENINNQKENNQKNEIENKELIISQILFSSVGDEKEIFLSNITPLNVSHKTDNSNILNLNQIYKEIQIKCIPKLNFEFISKEIKKRKHFNIQKELIEDEEDNLNDILIESKPEQDDLINSLSFSVDDNHKKSINNDNNENSNNNKYKNDLSNNDYNDNSIDDIFNEDFEIANECVQQN